MSENGVKPVISSLLTVLNTLIGIISVLLRIIRNSNCGKCAGSPVISILNHAEEYISDKKLTPDYILLYPRGRTFQGVFTLHSTPSVTVD